MSPAPRYLLAPALALLAACNPVLLEGDLHYDLGFVFPGGSGPGGPACADGKRGIGETDIDCGGSLCSRCADGNHCTADGDCEESHRCATGTCISCSDGRVNGEETDVDCGGTVCPRCQLAYHCRADSDCAAGACLGDICVQPPPLSFVHDPPATYRIGTGFAGMALADVDGDGLIDVAASDPHTESIVVMRGRGDGSFWPPSFIALGPGAQPGALAAGHLDGDKGADLVAVDGATVHVVRSAGGGGPRVVRWSQPATSVVLADFDGDKLLDAGLCGPDANAFGVLHGDGKGNLGSPLELPLGGPGTGQVAAGDLDGDQRADAVLNGHLGPTMVLLSTRGMKPMEGYEFPKQEVPRIYTALGMGHFDKDELLDVVDTQERGRIQVLFYDGAGALVARREARDGVTMPDSLAVADFNRDGRADVALAGNPDQGPEPDHHAQVFLGDGDGRLVLGWEKPVAEGMRLLRAGDLDGDGWTDLVGVTTQGGDNAVVVLINSTR